MADASRRPSIRENRLGERSFYATLLMKGVPRRTERTGSEAAERPPNERGLEVKLQAFRIAVTVSTLVMLVAASGAGKKWGR